MAAMPVRSQFEQLLYLILVPQNFNFFEAIGCHGRQGYLFVAYSQSLSALRPAPFENQPAAFGFHAFPKTMLIFSFAITGLVGSLHLKKTSLQLKINIRHSYSHKSALSCFFLKDKNGKHYLNKSQDFSKKCPVMAQPAEIMPIWDFI